MGRAERPRGHGHEVRYERGHRAERGGDAGVSREHLRQNDRHVGYAKSGYRHGLREGLEVVGGHSEKNAIKLFGDLPLRLKFRPEEKPNEGRGEVRAAEDRAPDAGIGEAESAHQRIDRLLDEVFPSQGLDGSQEARAALRTELSAGYAQMRASWGVDSLEAIDPAYRSEFDRGFEQWARETVTQRICLPVPSRPPAHEPIAPEVESAMDSISWAIASLERPNGWGWERPVVPREAVDAEIVRLRAEAERQGNNPGKEMEAARLAWEANRLESLQVQGGVPGAMLDIQLNGREAVVVGDLHGNEQGLESILESRDSSGATLAERLATNQAVLIFVGDAIHPSGRILDEMDPSIRTLDRIVQLQTQFPDQVFYTQGNHDAVYGAGEEQFMKGMVFQGVIFRDELTDQRRLGYTRSAQWYFDSSPLIVRIKDGEDVVAVAGHSPIVRGGLTPSEAVSARIGDGTGLQEQLTWNRPGASRKGYTDYDVALMRTYFGSERTIFVSGHTPGKTSAWQPGDGQVVLQATAEYNGNLSAVRVSPEARVEVMDFTGSSTLAGIDLRDQIGPSDIDDWGGDTPVDTSVMDYAAKRESNGVP